MLGFSLGRKIDFTYQTNRWLAILTVIIFGGFWLFSGNPGRSLSIAGGFFLCWALAREIDPANDLSAFLAGGVFFLGAPFLGGIELGVIFWMVLLIRLISKICGKTPSYIDLLVITAVTVFLVFSQTNSVYILLFGFALGFAYFRNGKNPVLGKYALLSLGIFLGSLFFGLFSPGYILSLNPGIGFLMVLALIILGGGLIWILDDRDRLYDDLGISLKPEWIRLGQVFYLLSLWFFLFFENLSYATYFIFFSVMVGVVFFSLILKRFFSKLLGAN